MTSSDDLIKYSKKVLKGKEFVGVIQREPYIHIKTPAGIRLQKTAGGVHLLMDAILRKTGGLMVAIAGGDADNLVVDDKGRLKVPPNNPVYTLKRLFLKKKELDGFYYGFANQTLWPLCHVVFVKPLFNPEWWDQYVKVNKKFANAIMEEIGDKDSVIWINDYHLALLPKLLKEHNRKLSVGVFWHIPWPTHEIFRICPWRKEILEGMMGADFIGFHRGYHVDNFVECARRELGVIVDSEPRTLVYNENHTKLVNLPAGIDYHDIKEKLDRYKRTTKKLMKQDFGFDYEYLAIGVDRVDYTKGLIERLEIIDRFLEKYPKYQGKFVYLSIGAPSRVHIPTYRKLNRDIADCVERINWKYSANGWKPIYFINKVFPRDKILRYYQLADVCMVTSLDDGMNLVAKEFIICSKPEKSMLILSKFTGAAKDLKSAILINPYDIEKSADSLYEALNMSKKEKLARNNQMKDILKENNIYEWGINFIKNTLS